MPMSPMEWSPLLDISEDDQAYRIKVELPEVKRQDISVTVQAGAVTIMGERKFEKQETARKHHRVERAFGVFGRSFSLPEDTNGAKVTAALADGILTVYLPKEEKVKTPEIKVQVS